MSDNKSMSHADQSSPQAHQSCIHEDRPSTNADQPFTQTRQPFIQTDQSLPRLNQTVSYAHQPSPQTSQALLHGNAAYNSHDDTQAFASAMPQSDLQPDDVYAVIPAGGTGTRLWPMSRKNKPKFLFDVVGNGRTLLQATFDRLSSIVGHDHVVISTGYRHMSAVHEQLADVSDENIIGEPVPRDSAGAIILAVMVLARRHGSHIIVGSFAADHIIRGTVAFESVIRQGIAAARAGFVTTIGIAASRPSVAFGYIHQGESIAHLIDAPNARLVERFVEKPDAQTAQAYLETGEYRWNAGMFLMRADVLLEHVSRTKPEMFAVLSTIADAIVEGPEAGDEAMAKLWSSVEKIAFDYAVAEPLSMQGKVAMIPGDFGWNDVGDFNSIAGLLPSMNARNMKIMGDSDHVLQCDCAGDIVAPLSNRTIALLGVNDMVIVDTPDALLVAPRSRSQDVKDLVKLAEQLGYDSLL